MIEASETLMELSAGQYQLDRDNRNDLIVIDHQDAGASRPVHTLSDGETFQASLALALALSRQVIGLSAGIGNLITSETPPAAAAVTQARRGRNLHAPRRTVLPLIGASFIGGIRPAH